MTRRVLTSTTGALTPNAKLATLKSAGAQYYVRHSDSLPNGRSCASDESLIRLVTSFSTVDADVDRFLDVIKRA